VLYSGNSSNIFCRLRPLKIRLPELCGSSRTRGSPRFLKTAKEPEKYRLEPHFVKENFFILFIAEILGNFCFLFLILLFLLFYCNLCLGGQANAWLNLYPENPKTEKEVRIWQRK
jgi:hypothetical protein